MKDGKEFLLTDRKVHDEHLPRVLEGVEVQTPVVGEHGVGARDSPVLTNELLNDSCKSTHNKHFSPDHPRAVLRVVHVVGGEDERELLSRRGERAPDLQLRLLREVELLLVDVGGPLGLREHLRGRLDGAALDLGRPGDWYTYKDVG